MCGIAGFVTFRPEAEGALINKAGAMADCMSYRGPDAAGAWADPEAGFATGHRRLAIVDLSAAGAQPMLSQSGRYVISYNGEIYNAADIRADLAAKGYGFRGHSDTEVLLEACAEWGIETAVQRMVGMFAFCLWDRNERMLWLVRDRLGIKPLYWGLFGDLFLFGSELKAFRAHPDFRAELNRDAVAAFLRFAYVPAPYAIYSGVQKLLPGTVLRIDANREPHVASFWSMRVVADEASRASFQGSDADAENELASLLQDAVQRRKIADVPLGAFLSGGIDSSTVAALMQSTSNQPVRTFSIGFREADFDEAPHAAAVARHLGTDHTELYVTPKEARAVIPRLAEIYDEPFADSSQIPTCLVSAMTREHVTVALSGDGGDEVFGGYNRHLHAAKLSSIMRRTPRGLRRLASRSLRAVPHDMLDRLPLPARLRIPQLGNKTQKLADLLQADTDGIYLSLVSQWQDPAALMQDTREPSYRIDGAPSETARSARYFQYLDTVTYLPDDVLTKVDRASMAVSLEVRVPLLDHRVVAFAWSLPQSMRLRDGRSKWILRKVLNRFVPEHLVERPKMGFGVPVGAWLKGPLRDWAETLLTPTALAAGGLLRPEPILAAWKRHLDGKEDATARIWTVLMLQAWREKAGL
jgi:asparagine synthase (glutamine-hydrolysing)